MAITFDTALLTGNGMIDTQHRELIDRVNRLSAAAEGGRGEVTAVQTLGFLKDYTELHFLDEEKLQGENAYPLLEAHRGQHNEFRRAIDELKEMLDEEEGPGPAFVAAVKLNLEEWLVKHIMIWDKQLAEYLRNEIQ